MPILFPPSRVSAVLLGLLLGGATAFPARADEPPAPAPPKTIREATAEELPPLLEKLKTAAKAKKVPEIIALLDALGERKHPEFEKPLQKFMSHAEPAVALHAAALLEERSYPGSGKALWAASWGQAVNDKRPTVRAKALRAIGRAAFVLDKRAFGDVESLWRQIKGTPNRTMALQLVDIAFYFETTKDKRLCRYLAEAIDDPTPTGGITAATPPAAIQEELYYLWAESKDAVHTALKAITGQEFESTENARSWFQEHEKDFGFAW